MEEKIVQIDTIRKEVKSMTNRLQILQGDCREILKSLPDASVQMCVTSPPYW
jgi:DNA modification methylase